MSDRILSPVQIDYMFVTDSRFHIEDSPSDRMSTGVSVSFTAEDVVRDDEGSHLEARVVVSSDLHDSDQPDDTLLTAAVVVRIGVRAVVGDGMSDEDARRLLAVNAVSLAYSHARSCVNSFAATSPAASFLIPGIDPWAVVDEVMGPSKK